MPPEAVFPLHAVIVVSLLSFLLGMLFIVSLTIMALRWVTRDRSNNGSGDSIPSSVLERIRKDDLGLGP